MSGAVDVILSSQGTGVRHSSNGTFLKTGDLTVEIWDSGLNGNLVYSELFENAIQNGSWSVLLGENSSNPLQLEYGKTYYKDYVINGEDVNFTNLNGTEIDRKQFDSPLGDINTSDIIDNSITSSKLSKSINLSNATGYLWSNIINMPAGFADDVDDTGAGATKWSIFQFYLYNDTDELFFNESKLNDTIDARDSDTTYSALSEFTNDIGFITNATMNKSVHCTNIYGGSDGNFCIDTSAAGGDKWFININYLYNDSTTLYLNESRLNTTIDARNPNDVISIEDYGAVGDLVVVTGNGASTGCSISSGSSTLECSSSVFDSGDVGQYIDVDGAGSGGNALVTTISAYTNGSIVTLTDSASTTVSYASIFTGTDDTTAIQNAINALNDLNVGAWGYHPKLYCPNGKYLVTNLKFGQLTDGDFYSFDGGVPSSCYIASRATSGDIINLTGREVQLKNIYLDSTFARRESSNGDGISANDELSRIKLENVLVYYQPQDGIQIADSELFNFVDVDSSYNNRYGIYATSFSPTNRNFHNIFFNVRLNFNGDTGLYLDGGPVGQTFINLESYSNGGTAQVIVNGGWNNIFINPDIENQADMNTTGLYLTGQGHQVYGGHISNLETSIVLDNCDECIVSKPYLTNANGEVRLDPAIAIDSDSENCEISVDNYNLVAKNITRVVESNSTSCLITIGGKRGYGKVPNTTIDVLGNLSINNSILLSQNLVQIKGVSSPPKTCNANYAGAIYYDSDINIHCACNSTNWVQIDDYSTDCS